MALIAATAGSDFGLRCYGKCPVLLCRMCVCYVLHFVGVMGVIGERLYALYGACFFGSLEVCVGISVTGV